MLRNVVVVDVVPLSLEFECSVCREPGALACSCCKSIKYCSKQCQVNQWPTHRHFCKEIKKLKVEIGLVSVNIQYLFGIIEPQNSLDVCKQRISSHWEARNELMRQLIHCGYTNRSKLALELAIEHFVDLLYMTAGIYPIYMLDLVYSTLIYLGRFAQILEVSKLIEHFKEATPFLQHDETYCFMFQYIAHVEIAREFRISMYLKFWSLMLGTHDRVGKDSPVQMIRGCTPILDMLLFHLLGAEETMRADIKSLEKQAVFERNMERIYHNARLTSDPRYDPVPKKCRTMALAQFEESFQYARKIGATFK